MAQTEAIQDLIGHWRWASGEGKGGADAYIRVRDAAQKDAFGRCADELERAARERHPEKLLALAATFRDHALQGWTPNDVKLPVWPAHRPAPTLDEAKVRREQQIGYTLALAACSSQLNEAAGGEV